MAAATLWRGRAPLLLASGSTIRRDLLRGAGLPVETEAAGIDERALEAGLLDTDPAAVALALARAKADSVARRRPGRVVVGADQVLAFEGRTWPKPGHAATARGQLARLAGGTHALHAAVVVRDGEGEAAAFVDTARLTMRPLAAEAIAAYVEAAGEAALRSAGGYEIEGLGIHLFERVEGDTSTVQGLPLLPLLAALRRMELLAW
jgi:septum formation protein